MRLESRIKEILVALSILTMTCAQPLGGGNPFDGNSIGWRDMIANQVQGDLPELAFTGTAEQGNQHLANQQGNALNGVGHQLPHPNTAGFT